MARKDRVCLMTPLIQGAVCTVQGHSAAVKEAVGASLLGCKAPFRLVQDHSRSGRLEASTLALRKWLFSEHFDRYLSLLHVRTLPWHDTIETRTKSALRSASARKNEYILWWSQGPACRQRDFAQTVSICTRAL